jgi:hypothetical protein
MHAATLFSLIAKLNNDCATATFALVAPVSSSYRLRCG